VLRLVEVEVESSLNWIFVGVVVDRVVVEGEAVSLEAVEEPHADTEHCHCHCH